MLPHGVNPMAQRPPTLSPPSGRCCPRPALLVHLRLLTGMFCGRVPRIVEQTQPISLMWNTRGSIPTFRPFKRVIVLWYRRHSDHHSRANGCGRGACQRNLPTQAGRWQLSQRGKVQGASRVAVPTPERGIRHLELEKAIKQIYAAIRSFWLFNFGSADHTPIAALPSTAMLKILA